MIKFLKYELKRSRGFFLLMAFISLISSLVIGLLTRLDGISINEKGSIFVLILAQGLVILTISLVYFAMRFKRDIFDKTSYISFTINISVGKILFAKLITSLIISFLIMLIYFLGLFIISLIFSITIFTRFNIRGVLSYSFILGLYFSMAYLIILLGISLSRVKIFKRYYSFVTIVLAIVVFSLILWAFRNIYRLSPTIININSFSLQRIYQINGIDVSMIYTDLSGKVLGLNIWTLILAFLINFLSFFINTYLIEERIDF